MVFCRKRRLWPLFSPFLDILQLFQAQMKRKIRDVARWQGLSGGKNTERYTFWSTWAPLPEQDLRTWKCSPIGKNLPSCCLIRVRNPWACPGHSLTTKLLNFSSFLLVLCHELSIACWVMISFFSPWVFWAFYFIFFGQGCCQSGKLIIQFGCDQLSYKSLSERFSYKLLLLFKTKGHWETYGYDGGVGDLWRTCME